MEALGLIETIGLVAATEGVDAMLKSAAVKLLEKTYVGGGLVSVAVTGDIGAVRAAVEAGEAAVRKLDESLLVSQHIIPRPHDEVKGIIIAEEVEEQEEILIEENAVIDEEQKDVEDVDKVEDVEEAEKAIDETKIEKLEQEETVKEETKKEEKTSKELNSSELQNKEAVDKALTEYGLEETIKTLRELTVAKLRKLVREYKDFGIKSEKISRANKNSLIGELKKYYENN